MQLAGQPYGAQVLRYSLKNAAIEVNLIWLAANSWPQPLSTAPFGAIAGVREGKFQGCKIETGTAGAPIAISLLRQFDKSQEGATEYVLYPSAWYRMD